MIRPDFTPNALRRSLGLGFRPLGSLRPSSRYRTPPSAHGALVNLQRKGLGPELTDSKGGGHLGRPGTPRPAAPGPRARFPVPGRIGNWGISGSRFPAESRKSLGFSKKKREGLPDSRFRGDEHQLQWARNRLSRECHASALTACGSFSGSERGKMQLPSASRDCARLQQKSDPASGPAWY
jgi:hypothetical protein